MTVHQAQPQSPACDVAATGQRGQPAVELLGHASQPRDDFGMSHGRTGNGGHRFWWKSEGRNSVG
jgi:hypothetical protein